MKLVITLVVLICFALNINAKDDRGYCYYFNDPHLIPFPSVPGEQQGVYFCKSNCTEVLLKNKFVEIFVTADPQGMYPIIEYTIVFFDAFGLPACALTDNIANLAPQILLCSPGSVATSNPSGSTYTHSHVSGDLEVQVTDMGGWFNIYIEQTFALIDESTGVCVDWDCEDLGKGGRRGRKKRQGDFDATFNKIIEIFVSAASDAAQQFGPVDESLVQNLRTAVLNDLRNTLDADYAKTIVYRILLSSAGGSGDDSVERIRKAEEIANQVIRANVDAINQIIGAAQICKEIGGVRKCLEPISG